MVVVFVAMRGRAVGLCNCDEVGGRKKGRDGFMLLFRSL